MTGQGDNIGQIAGLRAVGQLLKQVVLFRIPRPCIGKRLDRASVFVLTDKGKIVDALGVEWRV
jgi:hypothetical protein